MTPVLALDCDGVICDCQTPVHRIASIFTKRPLPPPSEWEHFDFPAAMGLTEAETKRFALETKRIEYWPHDIQLYDEAAYQVKELKKRFEVIFVTAPWKGLAQWVPARDKLLAPFNCPVLYVPTGEKHRVKADVFVDDSVHNIEMGGHERDIIFDRPWNRKSPLPRIRSLLELIERG